MLLQCLEVKNVAIVGYARVSTIVQLLVVQVDNLIYFILGVTKFIWRSVMKQPLIDLIHIGKSEQGNT